MIILDDDMQVCRGIRRAPPRHHPAGAGSACSARSRSSSTAPAPTPPAYVKEKFDLHLSRLGDPTHLNLPRSFYTGNASICAEVLSGVGRIRRVVRRLRQRGRRARAAAARRGVELVYDPEALAHQEYGKDLGGLQRDTLEKGRPPCSLARRHPEVFGDLRLASSATTARGPGWRCAPLLLSATRALPAVTGAIFAVASVLERLGLWRNRSSTAPSLDYAFWAGADHELRESNDEGELAKLAGELRRGPIDLLLHG